MLRGKQYALAGAVIALLLAGLTAHRLARAPAGPRGGEPPAAEDATVAAVRAIQARIIRKRQIIDEVIAGRRPLLEAAADFRRLDAEGPPLPPIRDRFPDRPPEDEAYCRSIVEYIQLAAPPDKREELARHLREELEARLRDGTLNLPGP